ncbi:MAG: hypothetical protein ACXWUC_09255, partial [Methylosarcina sp.]
PDSMVSGALVFNKPPEFYQLLEYKEGRCRSSEKTGRTGSLLILSSGVHAGKTPYEMLKSELGL